MFSGDLWEVAVIDVDRPSVSDRFLGYEPTMSPDGHYISFIKFFPPHAAENAEDHYMLYDLIKDAAHNRPRGNSFDDWQTVGVTVYPSGIGNHDVDNLHRPQSAVHMLSSEGFFWDSSSDQLVFADDYQGSTSVVLVDVLPDGKVTTRIAPVSADACGEKAITSCTLRLVGVVFSRTPDLRFALTFMGTGRSIGLKRVIVFDFAQFSTLGVTGG